MAVKMLPQDVADAFVNQYYAILNKCPENVHKFYQKPSLLGWPGPDGVMTPVTTLRGINDKIMSSDYKNCSAEIKTADAQESLEGGVIVAVTGSLTGKDNVKRNFSQTFFLAKQPRGFFVLNDILRFFDACETATNTAGKNDGINGQPAPSIQNSVISNISDSPTSLHTKAVVENGEVKEASDLSVSKDTAAKGASSTSSVCSDEKAHPAVAPASNEKVHSVALASNGKKHSVAPAANEKAHSVSAPASIEKAHSVAAPASNGKAESVAAPASNGKAHSIAAPASNEKEGSVAVLASNEEEGSVVALASNAKAGSVVAPASNAKVGSVVAPASNVTQKITYASVVAKETPVTSPRAARVTPNAPKQPVASPTAKPSALLGDGAQIVSTSGSAMSKAAASSSKVTPKLPTSGNGAPNTAAYAECKGIYIGGLPYEITKQGIVDVVKTFGPVRRNSDTVQIRRHEDGFCCGFVEFEHADSARRAVEAHHVRFGEKEAYITYKRSNSYRGNDGRGRSPKRGGYRNGNLRSRESEATNSVRFQNPMGLITARGQARGPHRS